MGLLYYKIFNLGALVLGVSVGYYATHYLLYAPKPAE